ncbi:MAG TPA: PLP-dependent aminotransferase family protein [Xanthomonadales bacterium]|nr:PLP-dependent aminotransferase family protein [Xanthomonadales bacterium]
MSGRLNFDQAPPPGHINFGVGQPSADLLPVELMRTAAEDFLRQAHPLELNYGIKQGDLRFRESLAGFLSHHYGTPAQAQSLFLTCGNSQALDFVCSQFTQPGDTVFVEEPSYFLAFQIFRDHGLHIVSIATDENGLDVEQLEVELARVKPAFLYTIPSFQNPGGQTLSAARRLRLVELSREYEFLVVADEVYQLLFYYEPPPAAFGSLAEEQGEDGTILSLGSFSKILAPALRLGWIQTSPTLLRRLLENASLSSSGSLNHFTSHVVRHAIDLGLQDQHLLALRAAYRGRVEAMDRALRKHLDGMAHWRKPRGGYFFWLELGQDADMRSLRQAASDHLTGFQPGPVFSHRGGFANCLRLSFAHYGEDDIAEGVQRLSRVLHG